MEDRGLEQSAKGTGFCGILLVICGVGSAISGFILVANKDGGGNGLWSGFGLMFTGILGIITWWKRNKGVMVGFLVMAIIMILAEFIQSIIAGVLYAEFNRAQWNCHWRYTRCYCNTYDYGYSYDSIKGDLYCSKSLDTVIGCLLAIVVFSVLGTFVAFMGSIFGCMGTCGQQPGQSGAVVIRQTHVAVTTATLPGYSAPLPDYSAPLPGYQGPQPDYQGTNLGYQTPQSNYQAPQPTYSIPQPANYSTQQPANYSAPQPVQQPVQQPQSSQSQTADEPPPVYTKNPAFFADRE